MATFGALRGVRLGHWERALLLYAPPPGSKRYGPRGVWIELTPLGAEVVDRYHHELESGLRIRWPQEEN